MRKRTGSKASKGRAGARPETAAHEAEEPLADIGAEPIEDDDADRLAGDGSTTRERGGRMPDGFQPTDGPIGRRGAVPADDPRTAGAHPHAGDVSWDLHDPLERSPGIEADRLGAGFDPTEAGDETGDASSPRPDENVADEIGGEVGVTYAAEEALRTHGKVADRDRRRWELDPGSSEDWADRRREDRTAPPEDTT